MPDGSLSSELAIIRQALRPVKALYGQVTIAQFGPNALKAVRQEMVDARKAGTYINRLAHCVRRLFKWAVAEKLVPVSDYQSLQAVVVLRRGRTEAPETAPLRPVPEAHVDAICPCVAPDRIPD